MDAGSKWRSSGSPLAWFLPGTRRDRRKRVAIDLDAYTSTGAPWDSHGLVAAFIVCVAPVPISAV